MCNICAKQLEQCVRVYITDVMCVGDVWGMCGGCVGDVVNVSFE